VGTVKKQKGARKKALKNRYCAGAKLSEHKFLRILRGFAEGVTLSALEPMTHTSGKTIRTTYRALRERLAGAVHVQPLKFGGAGNYLAHPDATALLAAIRSSAVFRRYRKLHAPRMKDAREKQLLVLEFAVRVFCALDLRGVTIMPDMVLAALANAIIALKHRDPLQKLAALIPGARPHAHPGARLYEDFRRHLLRSPLTTAGTKSVSCLQPTDSPVTISARNEIALHAHPPCHLDRRPAAPRTHVLSPAFRTASGGNDSLHAFHPLG
jgi:hypothetical protein